MANILKSTDIIAILTERTSSPKMQLLKVASVLASNSFLSLSLFFFLLQSRQKNWMTTGLEELTYFLRQAKLVQFFFFLRKINSGKVLRRTGLFQSFQCFSHKSWFFKKNQQIIFKEKKSTL